MKKINLTSKRIAAAAMGAPKKSTDADAEVANMMLDPRYLRQSSSLIQEALQKGFDVLQLANGNIITTGTKTIVYQYAWDEEKGKLTKYKPESRKAKREQDDESIDSDSDSESESEEA